MSNLDFEDDILTEIHNDSRRATSNAILGAQGNPQHAQRAIQLEAITGTPAAIAQDDIENEEVNARANMAGQIVQGNPTLQRYINRNVLAPTLSNDDWAILDGLTNQVQKSERPWSITRGIVSGLLKQNPDVYGQGLEAVGHLVPRGSVAEQGLKKAPDWIKSITPELAKQYENSERRLRDINWINETGEVFEVLGEMLGTGLASVAPVVVAGIAGHVIAGTPGAATGALAAGALPNLGEVYSALKKEGVEKDEAAKYAAVAMFPMLALDYAGLALGPLGQLLGLGGLTKQAALEAVKNYTVAQVAKNIGKGIARGAVIEGSTEFGQEWVKAATVTYATGKDLFTIDNVFDSIEAAIGGLMVGGVMHGPAAIAQQRQQMHDLHAKLKPYIDSNVEPPIGLDPAIDKMKAEQSKEDLEELDDQFKEAQKSTTRERSPETFEDLLKQETNAKVYVPFEQVVKLYGDNIPQPGDGILGDVPGLMEQLRTMALVNGDIAIPKSHWLSRVDPEVAKELHDFIKIRRSGFSRESLKEYQDEREAVADIDVYHGSPHEFDAFSMEAIGTGEGAQSYGYGLYFAENKAVADQYANMGAVKDTTFQVLDKDGKIVDQGLWDENHAKSMAEQLGGTYRLDPKTQSNLYRARIKANPEEFLDWDKPADARILSLLNTESQVGRQAIEGIGETYTGSNFYDTLARQLGSPEKASKALKEMGIPGIRYLDQGSRAAEDRLKEVQALRQRLAASRAKLEEAKLLVKDDVERIQHLDKQIKEIEDTDRSAIEIEEKAKKRTYNYVLFDDSLIEILDRNGEAVQAVRAQAALDVGPNAVRMLQISDTLSADIPLPEEMDNIEKVLTYTVGKALQRLAPKLRHAGARQINLEGVEGTIRGIFKNYKDAESFILWAFDSPNALGTVRHEVMHYLRRDGFITEGEWEALRSTAIKEDWIGKHRIKERYPDATPEYAIEEAIAEEYAKSWAMQPGQAKTAAQTAFEKLHMIFVAIKEELAKVLGFTPTAEEIFKMIESGEIGHREGAKKIDLGYTVGDALQTEVAQRDQGELDVTRQEDKPVFKTGPAMGISQPTLKKLLALITKRDQEDIEDQRKRAIAWQNKVQSAAWKEESDILEDEVRAELKNRPDIAASDFFRYGELYGNKLDKKYKLDEALLTPEQRASLPEHWIGKGGINPDDAAGLFGYQTGAELIDRLATVEQVRGGVRPGEFFLRLVKAETHRRMVERHGNLDENILAEAEEHVLGMTQMDLLHEQTVALGELAGQAITFTKEDTKRMAEEGFLNYPANDVDVQGFLTDSGKAGRKVIEAAAKEDWATAFKEQQAQYFAGLMGKEAIKFEKEMVRLDKLINRLNVRKTPNGIDNDYLNAAQWLMTQAGLPTKRSEQEIIKGMSDENYTSFAAFVLAQQADGYEIAIPDGVMQGVKKWDQMSVLDRKEFLAALKSLNAIGRKVKKVEVGGVLHNLDQYLHGVIGNITSLPLRSLTGLTKINNPFFLIDASLTRVEEMLKDLDLRQDAGPLWQLLYRPMMNAKHSEYQWQEKLVKKLSAMSGDYGRDWHQGLKQALPNDWFIDPWSQLPFNLTRGSMIKMMLNWGNRSNIEKFTVGWFGKDNAAQAEAKIFDFFETHATKKDWEFVQKIWDIFQDWEQPAEILYQKLSGVGPKIIPAQTLTTKHGDFRGGYFPVIKDQIRDKAQTTTNPNSLFGPNYQRSTPANTYTITRTGAAVKVSFDYPIEELAARMQQEIHDISFREPVIEAWKVLKHKPLRDAIRKHYGPEYDDQLEPWVRRIAGQQNMDEKTNQQFWEIMQRARMNVVGHSLPLNLKVLFSPDVGTFNLNAITRVLGNREYYVDLAWKNSKEIPHTFRNMDRDFREQLERTIEKQGFRGAQAQAVRLGFAPIVKWSQGFRIVTFVDEFEKALAKGMDKETAADWADNKVRERHGSGGVPDLPAVMSSHEGMKMITMFYGFFNMTYNWGRQIKGNVRREEYGKAMEALWGSVIIGSLFGAALFNKWEKEDNWFKFMGKAVTSQVLGMFPLVREAGTYFTEGFAPSTPFGSIIKATGATYSDIKKLYQGKRVEKPIQHTANVIGLSTGLPLGQIGRTTQFAYDVQTGRQRPQNFWQYLSGIIHGEAVRK